MADPLSEANLKPCPFCGSGDVVRVQRDPLPLRWLGVACQNCGAQSKLSAHQDRADKAWNRRTAEATAELRIADEITKSCGDCGFWGAIGADVGSGPLGNCRRHAPTTFADSRGMNCPAWPQTVASAGCGDFRPRPTSPQVKA